MNIKVNTGLKEYQFTDESGKVLCSAWINPTDPAFAEKLFHVFSSLDEKDSAVRELIQNEEDGVKVFEAARQMDTEMRGMIDEALGAEVCGPIFGGISVYAWADGLPLWANLLLEIIDAMDVAFTAEKKASDPRIKKYTEKFRKKAG